MIVRWSAGDPVAHMDDAILVELGEIVASHPWWIARATLTLDLLRGCGIEAPASVLDAGVGWGVTLEALEGEGYRAAGLDVSRRALERLDKPGRRLIEADLSAPWDREEVFDAVLALDVLEHLDDAPAALSRLANLARPGGAVIVSVPALPFLHSAWDDIQGHRMRYTRTSLRAVFESAGLTSPRLFYWGGFMVPLLAVRPRAARPTELPADAYRRMIGRPSAVGRALLRWPFAAERRLAPRGWVPAGTSVFGIAIRTR